MHKVAASGATVSVSEGFFSIAGCYGLRQQAIFNPYI